MKVKSVLENGLDTVTIEGEKVSATLVIELDKFNEDEARELDNIITNLIKFNLFAEV